jgi:hypothetical protein
MNPLSPSVRAMQSKTSPEVCAVLPERVAGMLVPQESQRSDVRNATHGMIIFRMVRFLSYRIPAEPEFSSSCVTAAAAAPNSDTPHHVRGDWMWMLIGRQTRCCES